MSAGCFHAEIGQTLNPSKNVMKNRTLATAVAESWLGMRSQRNGFLSKLSGGFQGGFGWLG